MGLMDDPTMLSIFDIVDPINFIDRLEKIPKFFFVSSDDEFMSMDWTNMGYYDKMKGEKHLLIKSNAEHSMATGLYSVMGIYGTMVRSLAAGITKRPSIKYEYNSISGDLSVIIPKDQVQPTAVKLKHAETISTEMRDFRWMVQSNGYKPINCTFPLIPLSKAKQQ
jgi:PhoPQ-activated pathogenicity-related protein